MTSLNHSNSFCFVTLYFPSSTPPSLSAASPSSPSSTGWTDKITKKIKELKSELESLKKLKEAKNGYLPEQDSKSLDSLPTQLTSLETMQKLAEFAEQLDTKNNKPTNILNNLCTGLEKFLGFDSTSKGYDGSGIVYSDLDRLCDGMMGFLSGVLEAVKDDEAVKKYDKYISGDKIDTVVSKLNTKIGTGRDGLVDAVEQVKEWLEGYWREVDGKNKTLIEQLSGLGSNIENNHKPAVEHKRNAPLAEQLVNWINQVDSISNHVMQIETNQVDKIDAGLQITILNELKSIKHVVKYISDISRDGDMIHRARQVDHELVDKANVILNNIAAQSDSLQAILKVEFGNILNEIKNMTAKRQEHFDNTKRRVNDAQKFLDESFDNEYKNKIWKSFNAIQNDVENINQYLELKKTVLGNMVTFVQTEFDTLKQKFGEPGDRINESLNGYWTKLKTTITHLVDGIYKNNADGHLYDIKKKVKEYVTENYTNGGFRAKTMPEWLQSIIKEDNTVKEWINGYVEYNKGHKGLQERYARKEGDIYPQLNKKIAEHILKTLENELKQEQAKIEKKEEMIQDNVAAVETFCTLLAAELKKSVEGKIVAIVDSIGRDKELFGTKNDGNHDTLQLTWALKQILPKLAAKALKAVTEFQWLIIKKQSSTTYQNSSLAAEIDKAVTNVKAIGAEFTNTSGSSNGEKIDVTLNVVKGKIDELTPLLRQGGTLMSQVAAIESDVLRKLKTLVKDNSDKGDEVVINVEKNRAEANMETLKSRLNGEIYLIRQAVNEGKDALRKAIGGVYSAYDTAKGHIKDAINKVRDFLRQKVREVFEILTSEVQKQFAQNRIADLKALKSLADKQLETIKDIINKDMKTGVKGLIRTVSGVTPEGAMPHTGDKLTEIKNAVSTRRPSNFQLIDYIKKLSDTSNHYVIPMLEYIINQVKDPTNSLPPSPPTDPPTDPASKLTKIRDNFDKLLEHLQENSNPRRIHNYDHPFTEKLATLSSTLHLLSPSAFANPRHPELLDAVKKGLDGFVKEMERVYVNGYDGAKGFKWIERGEKEVLTVDGRNGAKVFLTLLSILMDDLPNLKKKCDVKWSTEEIHRLSDLGSFLSDCGYIVSKRGEQDGELRRSDQMTGNHILQKLNEQLQNTGNIKPHFEKCESNKDEQTSKPITKDKFDIFDLLGCLHHHLETYYTVGHYATFTAKRNPCSVYEMLCWFSGLRHNSIYNKVKLHAQTMFDEKKNYHLVYRICDFMEFDFPYLCTHSYNLLTAIMGTGDQFTMYASDFANNSLGLTYPTSGAACFDMMLDILRRLFSVFRFLHTKCKHVSSNLGWADCQYGKRIPTTKSQCNGQPKCQSNGQPKCEPKCQTTCESKCQPKCETSCQPTSPLMCYLNDCLPGHLPHQLIEVGCKAECKTCPTSTPGMPCLTPLGFRAFSGSTKTGKELCHVIQKFFDIRNIALLFAISPKPPSTLPEHFGFALSLVKNWKAEQTQNNDDMKTVQNAFQETVMEQSIDLYSNTDKLIEALSNAYGSDYDKHSNCKGSHVRNLTASNSCKNKNDVEIVCAPYLYTLCHDYYYHLVTKHANLYLSWAIYLPWDFWKYLKNLYDEFCNILCKDWGCHSCLSADICNKGNHGLSETKSGNLRQPYCLCHSIVTCRGVSPKLYSFGFSFRDVFSLNITDSPNTCTDFCTQLNKVLTSHYFSNLFDECDNVLYQIRFPFMTLTLALWLLSLLYLLHIMVIRLDLLHIKSHLHSPSSHRIAAQSLLAAARVTKLDRVFYLQP